MTKMIALVTIVQWMAELNRKAQRDTYLIRHSMSQWKIHDSKRLKKMVKLHII